jgi:Ankyrin repeats (3 copies)
MLFRFLLVEFQLKHVLSKKTMRKRKDALSSLPSTIDEAYSRVMARIEKLEEDSKDLAIWTLSWIFHARRPLSMGELCEAVAIEDNQVDLDVEDLPSPSDIIDCCGSLVVHDSSGIIRFAHYTVSSFLENKYVENLYTQVDMARACLTYLCFDFFGNTDVHAIEWWHGMETYNFVVYASVYWDSYTRGLGEQDPSVQEPLFRFLLSPSKYSSMLAVRSYRGQPRVSVPRFLETFIPPHQSWLHIAAGFGLASICRIVMAQDEAEATPRLLTSVDRVRHTETQELKQALKATIKRDMLIWATDKDGITPLHEAAKGGYREVVIILLENGADINARDVSGWTPLHDAAASGFSCVVRTLLDKDADMTMVDSFDATPLGYVTILDVATVFLDKFTETAHLTLEELSSYTLHKIPSRIPIPQMLRSSFRYGLANILSILSHTPTPDSKYMEAFVALQELNVSLDPVNASVSRADILWHAGNMCHGCNNPIVGYYRYSCCHGGVWNDYGLRWLGIKEQRTKA